MERRNCSRGWSGSEDILACEGASDCLMGGEAVEAACADDRSDQGMDVGAPDRAEAVGDFAEDDAGSECPLGCVVGRRHVTVGHESEELGAPAFGLLLQFGSGRGRRRHRQPFFRSSGARSPRR